MNRLNLSLCLSLLTICFFAGCSSITRTEYFELIKNKADDSSLTSQQKEITWNNATILAFREQFENDPNFIHISEQKTEFYYDALVIILTSDTGRKHEIIQNLGIFESRNLHAIIAHPLSNAPFLNAWNNSSIETGLEEIDSILLDEGFEITHIYNWSHNNKEPTFLVEIETALNTLKVSALLEESGYFSYAEINGRIGDGNDINVKQFDSVYQFTFVNSYGDCPSGCIHNDKYIFNLTEQGNVEYIGIN